MRISKYVLMCAAVVCLITAARAQIVDRIVAIVNDDIVTLVDVEREAAPYLKNIQASQAGEEKKKALVKKLYNDVLSGLIDQSLTSQEAARYQIEITDAEIDRALETMMKQRSLSREEFARALEYEGLSLAEYRQKVKNQILQSRIINVAVKSKVVITQSEINAYYDSHQQDYAGKKKYQLRNILMPDRDSIGKVRAALEQGRPFAELARQMSTAPNAAEGGELGSFDISGFAKPIRESLTGLGPGEHTPVIETAQGYQIFFVQDVVVEGQLSREQAQDQIREILYREQVTEKFRTWLDELRQKAHIKKML